MKTHLLNIEYLIIQTPVESHLILYVSKADLIVPDFFTYSKLHRVIHHVFLNLWIVFAAYFFFGEKPSFITFQSQNPYFGKKNDGEACVQIL